MRKKEFNFKASKYKRRLNLGVFLALYSTLHILLNTKIFKLNFSSKYYS